MSLKLIAYDLNNETVRPNIVGAIRAYGNCVRLSESAYVVDTHESPTMIFYRLGKLFDRDDSLFVIPLSGVGHGHGPASTMLWLDIGLIAQNA